MNELALFAGAGGGILGGHLLGWRTVAAVEIEEYPRAVLLQRQADGILPRFPIWDDVCTFDGKPWRGKVDVISGGFPCQDISAAGKGAGITGERSGLWSEMARIIGEVRPGFVFVENSSMLTIRGLGTVLGDLAALGYDAEWGVLGADDAGAPHRRKRIWILAYASSHTLERREVGKGIRPEPVGGREELAYSDDESQRVRAEYSGRAEPDGRCKNVGDTTSPGLEGFPGNEPEGNQPGRLEEDADRPARPAGIRWWDIDPADLPDTGLSELQAGIIPEDSGTWEERGDEARGIIAPSDIQTDLSDSRGHAEGRSQGDGSRSGEPGEAEPDIRSGGEIWSDSPDSGGIWPAKSRVGRVAHGVAHRVDRLKAIGNGQVPAVAALALQILNRSLKDDFTDR